MVYQKEKSQVITMDNLCGGEGTITITHILERGGADFLGKGRTFARFLIPPGSSIGEHSHTGENEIYYVLSGHGKYCDNGQWIQIAPGDVMILKSNDSHAVVNETSENLELIGLILFNDSKN